ncbi:MAG: hypothetical protein KFB96_07005 [Thiocapsa sp.]|uniref:hypothetical protein n=1 Tax=Thiocapsa sp. TaxID=2024551 RepID=UPI001BCD3002|nr:hypothetical protein [Thiocapsa sp.]QVL50196.1 MAG: hypothetical protein KFB96_07005 [Thiocapsa sp.]
MLTSGWYEYYVVDPNTRARSLALAVYKPCDAFPEHAVQECALLRDRIARNHGRLPVEWLDDLLREQLGTLYGLLPRGFSVAAFLFLILRAHEDAPVVDDDPEGERFRAPAPEEPLRRTVAEAMDAHGFQPRRHVDPILDQVLFYVATGRFVRPWSHFARTWSVLKWLQHLTQRTRRNEMGLTAGRCKAPRHVSLVARFFIHSDPVDPFSITRLSIKLCDHDPRSLLDDPEDTHSGYRD